MVHQVPDKKCWNWQDEQWSQQKKCYWKKNHTHLPYQESNGSSMVGTQGLSSAVCENSCLSDVNELFVHKSTGKSVPKGMQRTPIRAHDPCYPNWSAGNMGKSYALCKEQAVTIRRLRKGCTSRVGKAGHSNAVWVWTRIRMQNVVSNLYKKILKFKIEKWVSDELYPEYARNIKKRCCWHCWMTSFWKFCWTTHVAGLWASITSSGIWGRNWCKQTQGAKGCQEPTVAKDELNDELVSPYLMPCQGHMKKVDGNLTKATKNTSNILRWRFDSIICQHGICGSLTLRWHPILHKLPPMPPANSPAMHTTRPWNSSQESGESNLSRKMWHIRVANPDCLSS